jgi:hypothetical protein
MLAGLIRRPELPAQRIAGPAEPGITGVKNAGNAGSLSPREVPSPLEPELVLDGVAERRGYQGEMRAQLQTMALSTRTKQALEAYLTQQSLPRQEAQNALNQMLGVDIYV